MKHFYSAESPTNLNQLLQTAIELKKNPTRHIRLGEGKLMVLLFFNASLRTKLSTQKAAMNLGMQVISMDMNCLLYTSPSPRDATLSRMPSSA